MSRSGQIIRSPNDPVSADVPSKSAEVRSPTEVRLVDVSATNVRGMGATQLVMSLLPALERARGYSIGRIILPDDGPVSQYIRVSEGFPATKFGRRLPNIISRALECLVYPKHSRHGVPVLVLGDLPLRHRGPQAVLIHTSHLVPGSKAGSLLQAAKYAVSRTILRLNIRFISAAIVQTETMRAAVAAAYPRLTDRLVVIPQPPPQWLLDNEQPERGGRSSGGLRLFYPAAGYPHKNHGFIEEYDALTVENDVVETITMTTEGSRARVPSARLVYRGQLGPEDMVALYASSDALLFPSLEESYGLPLVEAMFLGLPIVCSDRAYARSLCGPEAIYFDPASPKSLQDAVIELKTRLDDGWSPDWTPQLERIPKTWEDVAVRMLSQFVRPGADNPVV